MSRKQGPRIAGMRPSAIAAGRRHDAFENFAAIMGRDGMSRKQGPQACLGMRSPAIAAGRRHDAFENFAAIMGRDGMNRKQGPRATGMRPSAIAAALQIAGDKL